MKKVCEEILNVLEKPMNRREIMDKLNRPQTTINDALFRLVQQGILVKFREEREILGRPKEFYKKAEVV